MLQIKKETTNIRALMSLLPILCVYENVTESPIFELRIPITYVTLIEFFTR